MTTLLDDTAAGAAFRSEIERLSSGERFVAERIDRWTDLELRAIGKELLVYPPRGRRELVLRVAESVPEAAEARAARSRLRAAHAVGRAV